MTCFASSLELQSNPEKQALLSHFKMKRLRIRQAKQLAQSHRANNGRSGIGTKIC